MVATVGIYQAYGGSDGAPSESTDISSLSTRLATADQFSPTDTTYPIPIPATAGQFNYSFWIHVYLKITGGSFTKINNVRFYSDGAIGWNYGTGGELRRGNRDSSDKGCPMDTNYIKAVGTTGTTGTTIDLGHSYYSGQTTKTVAIQNDTSAAPATIDSSDHTTTGKCKAVVLQVKVAYDATQGEQADETLTFKYDEI